MLETLGVFLFADMRNTDAGKHMHTGETLHNKFNPSTFSSLSTDLLYVMRLIQLFIDEERYFNIKL